MKKRKNAGKILLIIAIVLSFIACAVNVFGLIAMSLNLGGVADLYIDLMSQMGYAITDVSSEISVLCMQFAVTGLVDCLAGIKYIRIIRRGGIPKYSSPFSQVLLQLFFGSFVIAIIGYIGIIQFFKNRVVKNVAETKAEFQDYRMEAMAEAITRLKELKEKGAISEDEYYETLNKILES